MEDRTGCEELVMENDRLRASIQELEAENAALRRSGAAERERLAMVFASMGESVLVLDGEGRVVATNAAWERMLGPPDRLVPEDERGRPLPDGVWSYRRLAAGGSRTIDFTLANERGVRRWFEAVVTPVEEGGAPRGGMIVVRDISDRGLRRLQERFLSVASHELRTPMTTLSGSLQLIERRMRGQQGEERVRPLLKRARDQVRRLELLIAELTDVRRLRGGIFRIERLPVSLTDVVRDAVEVAGDLSGHVEVRPELPDEPLLAEVDAARLEQVLLNLLINAFRHARGTERVDVRLRREGATAVIEVRDYGPGIPSATFASMFSAFQQVGEEQHAGTGLGLGLFTAREIVAAHGGTLSASTIDGEGATFEVRLPLPEVEPPVVR
jgi:two-component system CheB/CheR fusion protein